MAQTAAQNGNRKLYDPEPLCKALGTSWKEMNAAAVRSDLSVHTVRKALEGDSSVKLATIITLIDVTGVPYNKVFNARYYEKNKPVEEVTP